MTHAILNKWGVKKDGSQESDQAKSVSMTAGVVEVESSVGEMS